MSKKTEQSREGTAAIGFAFTSFTVPPRLWVKKTTTNYRRFVAVLLLTTFIEHAADDEDIKF